MNVTQFLDSMKTEYSEEKLENNENNFLEYFFYYKRNVREFLTAFKTYNENEQKRIVTFLVQMYPLSDSFLSEIFRDMKYPLNSEISMDTINYISSAFIEEVGEINIDFDVELRKTFDKILQIRDIIELNEAKMSKLMSAKKELLTLKEKDEKLSQEIKALESGDISALKNEVAAKTRKMDDLKTEKDELGKHLEKINRDLGELDKYTDVRERIYQCRDIIQQLNLPKDYADKL